MFKIPYYCRWCSWSWIKRLRKWSICVIDDLSFLSIHEQIVSCNISECYAINEIFLGCVCIKIYIVTFWASWQYCHPSRKIVKSNIGHFPAACSWTNNTFWSAENSQIWRGIVLTYTNYYRVTCLDQLLSFVASVEFHTWHFWLSYCEIFK